MCGIVGYVGAEQAAPILLEGLARLEYRGYDSAGVAVYSQEEGILSVHKAKGRLQVLCELLEGGAAVEGTAGVGHTRWATHGAPSDENSHPQVSRSGKIAVVHNGIIENYGELKDFLQGQGVPFTSEPDTEAARTDHRRPEGQPADPGLRGGVQLPGQRRDRHPALYPARQLYGRRGSGRPHAGRHRML